jgi:hypothetical protein
MYETYYTFFRLDVFTIIAYPVQLLGSAMLQVEKR